MVFLYLNKDRIIREKYNLNLEIPKPKQEKEATLQRFS